MAGGRGEVIFLAHFPYAWGRKPTARYSLAYTPFFTFSPVGSPYALAPSGFNFYHKLHKFPGNKNTFQVAKKISTYALEMALRRSWLEVGEGS